jgi:TolB-like protein
VGFRILRGLSVVALLLALGWVLSGPSWESGITAVVLLGGVISTFLKNPLRPAPASEALPGPSGAVGLSSADTASPSVVVLPFENLSGDPNDSYFSDGLTEEIITKLSQLSCLRVISRSSAMALKGTRLDTPAIGRKLNVQHVLEGSVRKAGSDLRIAAQLIDAENDSHVWADSYNGVLDDVFRIQESVAQAIVDALNLNLSLDEKERIRERPTDNVQAYDCLLRARQEIWRWTPDALARATKHLENGVRIIGDNADLLFGLGNVQFQYVNAGYKIGEEADAALLKAEGYAQEIFRIRPDSGQGHCLLGLVEYQRGKSREVVHHLKAALRKDPGNPDALWFLGLVYARAGQVDAARPLIERLVERDPLAPLSHATEGFMYQMEGRFEVSLPHYQRAFDMDPDDSFLRILLAYAHLLKGDTAEAGQLLQPMVKACPTNIVDWVGAVYGAALQREDAEVEQLMASEFCFAARRISTYALWIAEAYALLDDPGNSLSWLESAIEKGHVNYPFLAEWNPIFDKLREDPRFENLMRRAEKEWKAFEV